MYSIFFDNKVITFASVSCALWDIEVVRGEVIDTTKVLQKVENSKSVMIKAYDVEQVFNDFCSFFIFVEAAGGLVTAADDDVLMIFRNNRWDLPKGHVEAGETTSECALREVQEECSVSGLVCGELIAQTLHCYNVYGEWELKRTWWYAMSCVEKTAPSPQPEEGIEIAQWVSPQEVAQRLKNSYSTIQEVFIKAKTINLC